MENVVTDTQVHEYSVMRRTFLILFVCFFYFLQSGFGQNVPASKKGKEFYEKAQKAWQDRQLNEAIVLYEKVLQAEPAHAESHLRLAQIYELLKNTDLTKKHFSALVALQPSSPQSATAYHWLGRHYFQERDDAIPIGADRGLAENQNGHRGEIHRHRVRQRSYRRRRALPGEEGRQRAGLHG